MNQQEAALQLQSYTNSQQHAALQRIAAHAFLDDFGVNGFMALNVQGLDSFRCRHGLSQEDMNIAWMVLQALPK